MERKTKKLGFSFLPIPEELMRSKVISFGAKFLFGIIAKANLEEVKWSKKYLAKRMDCSSREVYNRIRELEENNFITVDKTEKGKVNKYKVNLELIYIIQGEEQMFHTPNVPRGMEHSVPGSVEYSVPDIKELSLKKNIKEENLLKIKKLKVELTKKKTWLDPFKRTQVQEEVAAQIRPSGKYGR